MNVIHKDAFDVYKAIFTFLLQIRRAKYVLKRLSMLKEDFRTLGDSGEGALYYSLRHRLLWFANTIYYYLTNLVWLTPRISVLGYRAALTKMYRSYSRRLRKCGPKWRRQST